jgi:hypothetical protein
MNKQLIIKTYDHNTVFDNSDVLFNVCNLWTHDNTEKPLDYDTRIALCNTGNWIDKFHTTYHKMTLEEHDLQWMKEAMQIGFHTKEFSHIYDDDLQITCNKYTLPRTNDTGWFIRTDKVSLKNGCYGIGPYYDMQHIIKSMVTTNSKHVCFYADDTSCNIYCIPWKEIDISKEFRVFVYDNNITAISVQDIYNVSQWLVNMTQNTLENIIIKIISYFEQNIRNKLEYINTYTYDFAFTKNDEPYFIEPNSFGVNYAAGSALFHWTNDYDKLHDNSFIEFRYVDK